MADGCRWDSGSSSARIKSRSDVVTPRSRLIAAKLCTPFSLALKACWCPVVDDDIDCPPESAVARILGRPDINGLDLREEVLQGRTDTLRNCLESWLLRIGKSLDQLAIVPVALQKA